MLASGIIATSQLRCVLVVAIAFPLHNVLCLWSFSVVVEDPLDLIHFLISFTVFVPVGLFGVASSYGASSAPDTAACNRLDDCALDFDYAASPEQRCHGLRAGSHILAGNMEEIAVVRYSTGTDEDGADITFDFNGKRMKVSLFPTESTLEHKPATEDHLIRLLGKAVEAYSDEYEDIMDKVIEAILDAGRPLFIKAAPPRPASDDLRTRTVEAITVQSYLFPETLDFRFQTINSIPTVFPIHSDEANTLSDVGPDPDFEPDSYRIDMKLPRYSAADLVPLQVLLEGSNFMAKVEIDGRDMVCKAFCEGLRDPGLIQELASLGLIQRKAALEGGSGLSNTQIRVPKLLRYITHAENGAIIGMLREWIAAGNRGDTLRDVDVSTVTAEIRQRWAEQIRVMVNWLHEIDIVWGDGKPSNVVIDQADNAWLIDFGGGWTEGWVDEEFAGSKRGDDQAVERIAKFLGM